MRNSVRTQLVLGLALMLIGFGFVVQLRSQATLSERLEGESEADLVEIIDQLDGEINKMRGELLEERLKLIKFQGADQDGQSVIEETENELRELRRFIGEESVTGPGIVFTVKNKNRMLTGFDVRQIIEELRASGAWALAVNGGRVDYRSSFWRRAGFVYMDGVKLSPNLKIEAIGAVDLMYQAITLPRGIRDKLGTIRGVKVDVEKSMEVTIAGLASGQELKNLQAVPQVIKQ